MVYKLVEVNGRPRIKLSQEITKVTIPGDKEAFRLLNADGEPLLDFLVRSGEAMPEAGRCVGARPMRAACAGAGVGLTVGATFTGDSCHATRSRRRSGCM